MISVSRSVSPEDVRELEPLSFLELASLLRGAPWRRHAVLGDSIAEGVREPHRGYLDPSWIDRIAEPLRAAAPGLTVMNLGGRDLRASEVRERQLAPALDFHPDLAIVAAGGNDALRRTFAPEDVARELDGIVGPLRAAGADVLMIELLDIVASGLVPAEYAAPLNERMRSLAALTRAVASRHGALLVEMRGPPGIGRPRGVRKRPAPPECPRARHRRDRGGPGPELRGRGEHEERREGAGARHDRADRGGDSRRPLLATSAARQVVVGAIFSR